MSLIKKMYLRNKLWSLSTNLQAWLRNESRFKSQVFILDNGIKICNYHCQERILNKIKIFYHQNILSSNNELLNQSLFKIEIITFIIWGILFRSLNFSIPPCYIFISYTFSFYLLFSFCVCLFLSFCICCFVFPFTG